ncbi:MAG: hypothetical protein JNL21_21680 [Myxococcales bacterium]|nr:hypothetical protein [Myxococcales bacterium]
MATASKGKAMTGASLFRTTLTSVFVLVMLAAAHLFMVVINAAEMAVAHPEPSAGVTTRMMTDRPLPEELAAALKKARTPEDRTVIESALETARAGKPVEIKNLPVTPFLGLTAVALTFVGTVLVWLTSRLRRDGAQTILGIFGGNLIWTGGIEYGLTYAARSLGISKTVTVINGELVGIYGEYVLLKHTWGALALVMVYLLFLESSRCPMFLWWRRNVPTMRGPVVAGRIDNYGPRTAFQYTTTVWGFYLLLLWAYDESLFGVHSLATKGILFASLAGTIYCVWALHQQTGWGPALRYAIGAMIVAWTPVEIAAKWGLLREPWLLLRADSLLIFFGGLALGTWALWRAQRRRVLYLAKLAETPIAAPAALVVGATRALEGRERKRKPVATTAAA